MPRQIKKDSTDITLYFFIQNASTGVAETGITITTIDLQYTRFGAAPSVKADATALAATDSAHSDNKAIEVDATSSPGLYRVDWPDAAFATGVDGVILSVTGSGLHIAPMEIQLIDFDPTDSVRLGLTALPNANADAAGGLVISDAGGLDIDTKLANAVPSATDIVDEWESQSQTDPTGFHVNVKEVNGTAQTANDNGADINAILTDTALMDKWLKNKIAFSGTSMILYDDDGTTPLLTWTLSQGSLTVNGPYDRSAGS